MLSRMRTALYDVYQDQSGLDDNLPLSTRKLCLRIPASIHSKSDFAI